MHVVGENPTLLVECVPPTGPYFFTLVIKTIRQQMRGGLVYGIIKDIMAHNVMHWICTVMAYSRNNNIDITKTE